MAGHVFHRDRFVVSGSGYGPVGVIVKSPKFFF